MSSEEKQRARDEERRKSRRKPCPKCGNPLTRNAKLCRKCFLSERISANHPSWKGGRNKTHGGYIQILQRDHPRANTYGYVLEHIVEWEKANNGHLPNGWIIHHLNGIKDDNRPQNLVALPSKKHYLVLEAKAKRIQELEGLLRGQSQLL